MATLTLLTMLAAQHNESDAYQHGNNDENYQAIHRLHYPHYGYSAAWMAVHQREAASASFASD